MGHESIQDILQMHAEVAMALGGFASVAAVFSRPLGEVSRQRFLALLFLALTQVLSCMIPLWLAQFEISEASLWRIASILYLAIASTVIGLTVIVPLRRIGYEAGGASNAHLRHFLDIASATSVILLVLNALGFPWEPGFVAYYASLAIAFSLGFVLFADVVLLPEDRR